MPAYRAHEHTLARGFAVLPSVTCLAQQWVADPLAPMQLYGIHVASVSRRGMVEFLHISKAGGTSFSDVAGQPLYRQRPLLAAPPQLPPAASHWKSLQLLSRPAVRSPVLRAKAAAGPALAQQPAGHCCHHSCTSLAWAMARAFSCPPTAAPSTRPAQYLTGIRRRSPFAPFCRKPTIPYPASHSRRERLRHVGPC